MFAKLRAKPQMTLISSVTTPASRSGNSIRSTSVTRLKAISSNIAMASSPRTPASIKALVTVLPDSY